jgi:hypothetical protein
MNFSQLATICETAHDSHQGAKEIQPKACHDLNAIREIPLNSEPTSNVIRLIVLLFDHCGPRNLI